MFGFLGNVRLLYVLIPAGALAAAVMMPNLDVISTNEGCATSEVRPCYDQGTKNKVKEFKGDSGAKAYAACTQNSAPNASGMFAMETSVCQAETVSYCMQGNSENFVREFTGTCQDDAPPPEPEPEPVPIPDLDQVNISGTFINAVTKEPVSGVRVWDPSVGIGYAVAESSGTGEFAFSSDTTAITQSNTLYTNFATGCYFQNWGFTSINRNPDDSLRLKAIMFDFIPGDFAVNPLMSADVELGDVPLWPATTLVLQSDVPVQLSVSYPEENKVLGNSQLEMDHKLWNAIPLEQPTVVRVTDANGVMYYSPAVTLPESNGCDAAVLNFSNGEFAWQ